MLVILKNIEMFKGTPFQAIYMLLCIESETINIFSKAFDAVVYAITYAEKAKKSRHTVTT